MMVQGRVTFCRIAAASCSAAFGSRYSLTNFTEFLFYSTHLFQVFEDALRFLFVDHADRESDVDQRIVESHRVQSDRYSGVPVLKHRRNQRTPVPSTERIRLFGM